MAIIDPRTDNTQSMRETASLTRRGFLVATTSTLGIAALAAACGDGGRHGPDVVDADLGGLPDVAAPRDGEQAAEVMSPGDSLDSTPNEPDIAAPEVFDPAAQLLAPQATFPLGAQSGDPTPDRVIFQCLFRGAGPLELVVFATSAGAGLPEAGVVLARRACQVAEGGFVHVDVTGLPSGAPGLFCFIAAEGRGPVGAFKTAPGPTTPARVVFGATSCASYTYRPFDVLTTASGDDLDFFVLLGDTVYADDASSREAYRDLWSRNISRLEYQAFLTSQPVIATWDDHEVENNWDPETVDPIRLGAARGAFFEHLAVRRDDLDPNRIYRSFRFGSLVELFMLDCRSYRRPSTRKGPDAQYLGEAQVAWLTEGLKGSDATFKVIANSVPITKCPPLFPGDSQRRDVYAAARAAMIEATAGIEGLVWLAGDLHFGAVARVDPPGGRAHAVTEVLVGPVAHLNPALSIIELSGSPQQFVFTTAERNYGRFVAEESGDVAVLTVEHVGTAGQILNSHRIAEVAR